MARAVPSPRGQTYGCARVSTDEQGLDGRVDELTAATPERFNLTLTSSCFSLRAP